MNRGPYRPPPTSKASASTQCQKCLKRDNYECKSQAVERPYVARPSRTQQLMNPKLTPKLTSDIPNDLMRRKGIADEQLAKSAAKRGRKRSRSAENDQPRKGSRSISSYSSDSVSTISTTDSRPASPKRNRRPSPPDRMMTSQFEEGDILANNSFDGRKRRRSSGSSMDEREDRNSENERNTRRRRSERSPGERGRRRSREDAPDKRSRSTSVSRSRQNGRRGSRSIARERHVRSPSFSRRRHENGAPPPLRERSMSPYSKRLALTAAMNTNR